MRQLGLTITEHLEKLDKAILLPSSSPRLAPHPEPRVGILTSGLWREESGLLLKKKICKELNESPFVTIFLDFRTEGGTLLTRSSSQGNEQDKAGYDSTGHAWLRR